MKTESIVAIVSGVTAFVLSLITLYLELRKFNKSEKHKIVSNARVKWLDDFRDEVSNVLVGIDILLSNPNTLDKDFFETLKKADFCKYRLITKLSTDSTKPENEYFNALYDELTRIDFNAIQPNLNKIELTEIRTGINRYSRLIAERIWSQIKDEVKGG